MLFVLTGEVQTGKTRWLEAVIDQLTAVGVQSYGVIAPGVWREAQDAHSPYADENGFEKLGIENVLLPDKTHITFARRPDIAAAEGLLDENAQSARANLKWHISDSAIDDVNEGLAAVRARSEQSGKGLLVIDELGILELLRGGGLVEAVALLEEGPKPAYQHALVVVRERLLPEIEGRFPKWDGTQRIFATDEARAVIHATYGISA